MKRIRIRDLPFKGLDIARRPYFLDDRMLSVAEGFVPTLYGGYKRTPEWPAHWTPPEGYSIIGTSPVGELSSTKQITVALKPATGNLTQYRIYANGTGNAWGGPSTFGSNQDNDRDRIVYHRTGDDEYTLGWEPTSDPDASNPYGCHLLLSRAYGSHAWPIGSAPISHSGVTATPHISGGYMAAGYCRIYLIFNGSPGGSLLGATDQNTKITAHTTGGSNTNKVALSSIPTTNWPGVDYVYIYRTRVCSTSQQTDFEPAYLCATVSEGTTSADLTISDANLVSRPQLEIGKIDFPGLYETGAFCNNLGLSEHGGRLMCWGVKNAYTVWFSGYTDVDGVPVVDHNWWGYGVELPGRDTVVSVTSFRGKCLTLGENGLYRLRDEASDPSFWFWERMAATRGEYLHSLAVVNDVVFIVGRGIGGEWNIWACDGYNLKPVGDRVRAALDEDTGVISLDGMPLLVNGADSKRYVMNPEEDWGRQNVPSEGEWTVGRDSSFQSGTLLLAGTGGVYYEGSTYSDDESDYVVTRDFLGSPEERTEWEKVYVFANKVTDNVTLKVYGAVDGGSWTLMDTVEISATSGGITEAPVPPDLRQGRRFQVKVTASTAAGVVVEGITVQARPTPEMT